MFHIILCDGLQLHTSNVVLTIYMFIHHKSLSSPSPFFSLLSLSKSKQSLSLYNIFNNWKPSKIVTRFPRVILWKAKNARWTVTIQMLLPFYIDHSHWECKVQQLLRQPEETANMDESIVDGRALDNIK